ncbi:unnamed protein product [Linum tenue]|uniref:Uncharacterized protein n=1 Tax=Linum tenue TaxID=586396 RepID=A0AAV0QUG8_9ROSI|nr:unnamed protein product [Linum tenue]
MFLITLTRL